jgi:hypothetical protein
METEEQQRWRPLDEDRNLFLGKFGARHQVQRHKIGSE